MLSYLKLIYFLDFSRVKCVSASLQSTRSRQGEQRDPEVELDVSFYIQATSFKTKLKNTT